MNLSAMNNNILTIKNFFQKDNNTIIFNNINEKINSFYIFILEFYAQENGYSLKINDSLDSYNANTNDLFLKKFAYLFFINTIKNLNSMISGSKKNIIFVNYKNFKTLSKNNSNNINCYDYKKDIVFFLKSIKKINNEHIISNIIDFPELIYSETSKVLVDINQHYSSKQDIIDPITDIRKCLYSLKLNNNQNIKEIFSLIKKEVIAKKFNFLTS